MKRNFSLIVYLWLCFGVAFAQETWMPDPGLREAVRERLNLDPNQPFSRADLEKLHRLDPYQMGLKSLKGLEHAKNLTWFSFAKNDVTDLSPLAGLTQLQTLYGWTNRNLSDLSPIANLKALETLKLAACDISDITPLGNLRKLESLSLSYNNIENIEPIGNLSRLTELLISYNKIVDVRPLSSLHRLETLHIDNNRIRDFSSLQGLEFLDFIYDEVCRIPPFSMDLDVRFENRSYPSIFQAWSDVLNRPDLSSPARSALHDLYWSPRFSLDFMDTPQGMQLVGDLDASRQERYALSQMNPNIIVLAEISVRDEWPRAYPEDWQHWIRDENGNRVPATGYPAFLMDFTHPEVQDIIVEQAIAVRKCGLYDGIFLDWWNEKGTVLWTDFTKPTRTNAAEQAARDVIIRRIRAGVGEDFLIIVNHNRQKAERAGPYINGLFMETLRDNENGYTRDGLIKIESTLLWAEENLREPRINCLEGWGVVSESPASANNRRWMRAFTALSLTHSDGYVLFNDGHNHTHNYYDFWDAELGHPVGERAVLYQTPKGVSIDGLFIREFENGWAVYNRSGKERRIQLPETVSGVASSVENKRWHIIPDLDGEIYLKPETVEVGEVANPADLNSDGTVNVLDLIVIANALGADAPDLNGDGTVNVLDLIIVAQAFE